MRPLRGDDRVPATLPAAIATRECRLRRIVISGRIVALVALANATRVRRNGNRGQRQRGEVSSESEQQQKSGSRALHKLRRSRVPRSNKNSTDQIACTNWRKLAQRRFNLPQPVEQHPRRGRRPAPAGVRSGRHGAGAGNPRPPVWLAPGLWADRETRSTLPAARVPPRLSA